MGERSGLIIGPSRMDYTVTSSDPDTVLVEQITGFWVAVANAPASPDSANQPENLEIRQELIRLINQTRKNNGVSELRVNEALMNAAQICSDRRYTWYHSQEECQAAAAGYPYGFGDNLTVFTSTEDAAQHALDN